jgi:hypothetical protein
MPKLTLPSPTEPIVTADGKISVVWYRALVAIVAKLNTL